jgi:hypothetical protein
MVALLMVDDAGIVARDGFALRRARRCDGVRAAPPLLSR